MEGSYSRGFTEYHELRKIFLKQPKKNMTSFKVLKERCCEIFQGALIIEYPEYFPIKRAVFLK